MKVIAKSPYVRIRTDACVKTLRHFDERMELKRVINRAPRNKLVTSRGSTMRTSLMIFFIFIMVPSAMSSVAIDTVPIGDPGNPNDPATGSRFGRVSYRYNIGMYEVTVGQYVAFLNAVAQTDNYLLSYGVAGIAVSGDLGSYTYSVIGSPNQPITRVNWGCAARFSNWLHNGQPTTHVEDASTTEDGAYTLNGAVGDFPLDPITRNANARWFIPSENEWYKAAYYQPAAKGGDSDSYWAYPMKTNNIPFSDQPPGATPDNSRAGNFYQDDGAANGYDDGFAISGSPTFVSEQNYLTEVGEYASSPSFYGTFDQGGNVWEWTDTLNTAFYNRLVRGGSWEGPATESQASFRRQYTPMVERADSGFRIASVQLSGDFNGNGIVDTVDFVMWRKAHGSAADYNLWRANFGGNIYVAGSSVSVAVPEPSALSIVLASTVTLLSLKPRYRLSS